MELRDQLTIDLVNARKKAQAYLDSSGNEEPLLGSVARLRRASAHSLIEEVDVILEERKRSNKKFANRYHD